MLEKLKILTYRISFEQGVHSSPVLLVELERFPKLKLVHGYIIAEVRLNPLTAEVQLLINKLSALRSFWKIPYSELAAFKSVKLNNAPCPHCSADA